MAQRVAALRELLDAGRFPETQDHSSGVAREAVVSGRGEVPEVLVALAVTRTHGRSQAVLLPAFPELFLEDLPLMRIRELEEELFLLRQDDRRDELGQPLAVFFGKRRDAFFLRGLLRGRLARAGSGE